jgi:hypothetical protein
MYFEGIAKADAHPLLNRPERQAVEKRAYIVRASDQILDVRVLDLSYDGCGIETQTLLEPGEEVTLSVLSQGVIKAQVKWCKGRKAGLQFGAAERKQRPRQIDRTAIDATALLRRTGRPSYRVQMLDFTAAGCRCEFVDRPIIDEVVWIKFEGIEPLAAMVRWVEGSATGLRFERQIHPAVFAVLLDRLSAGSPVG